MKCDSNQLCDRSIPVTTLVHFVLLSTATTPPYPLSLFKITSNHSSCDVQYWDAQEPTYNGVLGGFGFVSDIDVRDSKQLLLKVRTQPGHVDTGYQGTHQGFQDGAQNRV